MSNNKQDFSSEENTIRGNKNMKELSNIVDDIGHIDGLSTARKSSSTAEGELLLSNEQDITKYPDDGKVVGTKDILNSKNVFFPIELNERPIDVPSTYKDTRGEIHNLYIGNKRFNILHTKANVMRSGDIHEDTQHDFIFSGAVIVWTLNYDGTTNKTLYGANTYISIPPYTPHIFEFIQDTVMAEYWNTPFRAWFYIPYRTIVEQSFQQTNNIIKNKESGIISQNILLLSRASAWVSKHRHWLLCNITIGISIGLLIRRRGGQ